MILFVLVLVGYVAALVFIRPTPKSLKAKQVSYLTHMKSVMGSLLLGVFVIVWYWVTTGYTFITPEPELLSTLSLYNSWDAFVAAPFSLITHLFTHTNLLHLLGNLMGIGIFSVYENRVGTKRYLMVVFIALFASIFSIFFYTEPVFVNGVSGAVFGLGAAFFIDYKKLNTKEYIQALMSFVFMMLIVSIADLFQTDPVIEMPEIDYIGHILGALGVIVYVTWSNRKRA